MTVYEKASKILSNSLLQCLWILNHAKKSLKGFQLNANFKVSVIVPVYMAEKRVRRAVESAAFLDEVGELILVEDGSTDNSLLVCRQLNYEFEKVKLTRHPDSGNHGAGSSRNLGIDLAQYPFVAFLDADDWYLPNRFEADRRILCGDPSIDGVYNALGNSYDNDQLRQDWLAQGRPELLTMTGGVPSPEELPLVLLHAHPTIKGEFSTDTITVRRAFLDRVGNFHPQLRLQQDTHLWKRMSAFGRLAAGNLNEPVAIRGVHANNRMTKVQDHFQYIDLWWSDLGRRFRTGNVRRDIMQAYRRGYAKYRSRRMPRWRAILALANWLLREPRQARTVYGFLDLALLDMFNSRWFIQRLLSAKNRLIGIGDG